jgi:SAM-dependent methyltransferase
MLEPRFADLLHRLAALDGRGGPKPDEYADTVRLFEEIAAFRADADHEQAIRDFRRASPSFSSSDTMHGFVCNRPHGYAGDFEIIDRIYTGYRSSNPDVRCWDEFFHTCDAVRAVVGRKAYCLGVFADTVKRVPNARILNVACGPCRDVLEFKRTDMGKRALIHCVDADAAALGYASRLLSGLDDTVSFDRRNAFRLRGETYDLVWCAGLFDYLDDRTFVRLLRTLAALTSSGEVVIGNFSPDTKSRAYMEFGEWRLNYRSRADLLALAATAGFHASAISVDSEETGINLFLRVGPLTHRLHGPPGDAASYALESN